MSLTVQQHHLTLSVAGVKGSGEILHAVVIEFSFMALMMLAMKVVLLAVKLHFLGCKFTELENHINEHRQGKNILQFFMCRTPAFDMSFYKIINVFLA